MPTHSQPVSVPDIYQSLNLDRMQPTAALYSQVTSGIQQLTAQGTPESDYTLQLARYAEQVLRDDASRSAYEQSLGVTAAAASTGYPASVRNSPTVGDSPILRLIAWLMVSAGIFSWVLNYLLALIVEDLSLSYTYLNNASFSAVLAVVFGLAVIMFSGSIGTPGSRPAIAVAGVLLVVEMLRSLWSDYTYMDDWGFLPVVDFLFAALIPVSIIAVIICAFIAPTSDRTGAQGR